jgi:tight adherence protein C
MIAVNMFLAVSSLVLLLYLLVSGRSSRLEVRLDELAGKSAGPPEPQVMAQLAQSTLPTLGAPLVPRDEEERNRLQGRLIHAGFYGRQTMVLFSGVKMLLILSALLGLGAEIVGLVPVSMWGLMGSAVAVGLAVFGPSLWLDRRKAERQTSFRRALPDALDVLVICLEGGLSLAGAIRRVAGELRTAHPLLAGELDIIQREMQLGLAPGEALRHFANRADLEEVRGLASVITQAERLGASLIKALRVHSDALRTKRVLYAEEMAQKAAVKILFPTFFCIFPGIYVVILGPAVFQIAEMFSLMD